MQMAALFAWIAIAFIWGVIGCYAWITARKLAELDAVNLLDALELPVLPGVKELGLDIAIAKAYLPVHRGTTELY